MIGETKTYPKFQLEIQGKSPLWRPRHKWQTD